MIICGVKLTHDGGVALIDDGRLVFSVEMEKLANNPRHQRIDDLEIVKPAARRVRLPARGRGPLRGGRLAQDPQSEALGRPGDADRPGSVPPGTGRRQPASALRLPNARSGVHQLPALRGACGQRVLLQPFREGSGAVVRPLLGRSDVPVPVPLRPVHPGHGEPGSGSPHAGRHLSHAGHGLSPFDAPLQWPHTLALPGKIMAYIAHGTADEGVVESLQVLLREAEREVFGTDQPDDDRLTEAAGRRILARMKEELDCTGHAPPMSSPRFTPSWAVRWSTG